jgi:hypothetical protein
VTKRSRIKEDYSSTDWRADAGWVMAIEAVEQCGDLDPLVKCFAAKVPISPDVFELLADLFDGRTLSRGFVVTDEHEELLSGAYECRKEWRKPKESQEQAIRRVARARGWEGGPKEQQLRELVNNRGQFAKKLRQRLERYEARYGKIPTDAVPLPPYDPRHRKHPRKRSHS